MVQLNTVNPNYRVYNSQNQSAPKNIKAPAFTAKLPGTVSHVKPKSFMALVAAILAGTLTIGAVTEHAHSSHQLEEPSKVELVIKNQKKMEMLPVFDHQPHVHPEEYEKGLPKLRKAETYIEPPKDKKKLIGAKSADFLKLTKKIARR
ncbi:MAG TPA: hypothetical protein DDX14_02635 [Cyanobacteria bacterium UBA9579]|nr:hypothetical protein [Cyanobacteria bacterium UBA9579]